MSLEARTGKPYCTYCYREQCICYSAPQVVREMLGAAHQVLHVCMTPGPWKAAVSDNSSSYLLAQARPRIPDQLHQRVPRGSDPLEGWERVDDNPRMETPQPSARMEVRLETADGSLVTQTAIPSFQAAPKVIIWGDRVFGITSIGCDPYIYKEVFSYVLP